MKRVIIEVLPTPWSPRNTNLYLASGEMLGPAAELVAAGVGVPFSGADIVLYLFDV